MLGLAHGGSAAIKGFNDGDGTGGPGVWAESNNSDGVVGVSHSPTNAGVSANSDVGGYALRAVTGGTPRGPTPGNAVYAISHHQGEAVSANNDGGGAALVATGKPAGFFYGDVFVTGDVILVNSPNSGDVAEDFDLEDDSLNTEPGTVLVINSNGKLAASSEAYDTRVAGVVSGAGEFKPALVLQRIVSETQALPHRPHR